MESLARKPRTFFALVAGALAVVALAGCAIKHPTADLVVGKQLYVGKCGSCHTLARASTSGQVGPNLDDAFRQDRADGVKSTSIQGMVDYWIRYPNTQGVMPARLFEGQKAQDVAAYVGAVAGKRNAFDTANVPGAELTLGKPDKAQEPTKGRSLDHIGFEVKNLDQFTKTLQADGIMLEAPGIRASANAPNLRIAYIFDPWGTYIELTEGLTPKSTRASR